MHSIAKTFAASAILAVAALGCSKKAEKEKFDTETIGRRDIAVTVEASGAVEPLLTVEIKSKASGEVLKAEGQTGEIVKAGTLLVLIDKRAPRNNLAQAEADLEAAVAQRAIAKAQYERGKKLFESRTINEVDFETNQLTYANSKASVVRSQVAVENARITLDDTDVRAPITGTIIEKLVETGQVISSPMKDFGGGTSLMKMADLSTVQVRALVDETDVGKIQPGKPVLVKVTAYPNQPFPGTVDKIEPQAKEDQSVTTFAVLIRLPNPQGLLKPGMNADVEIKVDERLNVVAVPTGVLHTQREIPTMATELGLAEDTVRQQLGDSQAPDAVSSASPSRGGPPVDGARPQAGNSSGGSARPQAGDSSGGGARPTSAGRPAGAQRPSGGGWPSGAERPRTRPTSGGGAGYEYGGSYWTFVNRDGKPVAVNVTTGLTNLEYNEVINGLKEGDQVILLPSAGLLAQQARGREQMRRFSVLPGGGGGGSAGGAGRQGGAGAGGGGQQGGGGAPR